MLNSHPLPIPITAPFQWFLSRRQTWFPWFLEPGKTEWDARCQGLCSGGLYHCSRQQILGSGAVFLLSSSVPHSSMGWRVNCVPGCIRVPTVSDLEHQGCSCTPRREVVHCYALLCVVHWGHLKGYLKFMHNHTVALLKTITCVKTATSVE